MQNITLKNTIVSTVRRINGDVLSIPVTILPNVIVLLLGIIIINLILLLG